MEIKSQILKEKRHGFVELLNIEKKTLKEIAKILSVSNSIIGVWYVKLKRLGEDRYLESSTKEIWDQAFKSFDAHKCAQILKRFEAHLNSASNQSEN